MKHPAVEKQRRKVLEIAATRLQEITGITEVGTRYRPKVEVQLWKFRSCVNLKTPGYRVSVTSSDQLIPALARAAIDTRSNPPRREYEEFFEPTPENAEMVMATVEEILREKGAA
ncbi:hypothetical protein CPHO_07180 [Corynebacterium phocae]|uniref:Uncharacterized protein n=1 Tax=Corynebacterium phocae TaxID=161895 RepID=A0A1L7D3K8_9CORY|nr:hypothetical protein [Corynebacterium phocae]APT92708.1 hypothetical protein CPHO_07180 [Corynebacterium phocae]KAA8723013.1 hypothetical protein F4V58_06685 [Corynebacterium phocae]